MNALEFAGLGRIQKELEPITGLKVKYHSLTAKEEKEILHVLSQSLQDLGARSSVLVIETLVRAIESIGDRTFNDVKDLREYLENLQRPAISTLWDSFQKEIDQESNKKIDELKKN